MDGLYTNINQISTGASATDIQKYRGRNDPEAIRAIAKEMETIFAYQMVKTMRESTLATGEKSFGSSTYTSLFDMELARLLAEKGLGLEDMLLRQLGNTPGEESDSNPAGED